MKRGLHHIHQRKRMTGKTRHPFPSDKKFIKILDYIVLSIAFIAPFFELPQLFEIFMQKSAENGSVITWGFFALMAIPWFIYGIIHKEKPIIIL